MRNLLIVLGFIVATVFSLTACNPEVLHASAPLRIKDPWLRWQPETNSGELYFYIANKSTTDDALIAVKSKMATQVEMYNVPFEKKFSDVVLVPSIELPVEQALFLVPGGPHIKLIGLSDITPGKLIPITLEFEQAGEFSFYAEAH